MEKYIVVYKIFKDLQDKGHIYKRGDIYPREGYQPTQKRIKELASKNNKIGETLIKKIEEPKEDKEPTEDEQTEEPKEDKEPTENEKTKK